MKKMKWVILLLFLAMLLSACGKEIDVYPYDDASWEVRQKLSINPDLIPSISGEVVPGFSLGFDIGALTDEFIQYGMEQLVWAYERKGVDADWNRQMINGEVVYNIQLRGEGWQALQDWGLGGDVESLTSEISGTYDQSEYTAYLSELYGTVIVEPLDNGQVYLKISPSESMEQYPNFGTTFRLHAGSIISSNASKVSGGTATWNSPVTIEAVFVPASRLGDLILVAGIIGGGGVLAGAGWLIYKAVSHPRYPRYKPARRPAVRRPQRRPVSRPRRW